MMSMSSDLSQSQPSTAYGTGANTTALHKKNALKKIFEKKLVGFHFATLDEDQSLLGMLYHSRIPLSEANARGDIEDSHANLNPIEVASVFGSKFSSGPDDSDDDEENDVLPTDSNPRQQLAHTVSNWSRIPENHKAILQEGAVHAIIALTGTDDFKIKKSCIRALYHLSLQSGNRKELIGLGGAGGVIAAGNNMNKWKYTRYCATTLCNLTIEPDCEGTLLGEAVHISLITYLGRGSPFVPVCAQGLFNLTQIDLNLGYSKGNILRVISALERVIKALLTIPYPHKDIINAFDPTMIILNGIVNCTRFLDLHNRILEDSALNGFFEKLYNIPEKTSALALNVCLFIRSLTEMREVKDDSINKEQEQDEERKKADKKRLELILRKNYDQAQRKNYGPCDLLAVYNDHCDDEGRRQLIKALSNLVDCSLVFPFNEMDEYLSRLMDLCTHSISLSNDPLVHQHGIYSLYALTKVQGTPAAYKAADRWPWSSLESTEAVVDIMEKLLGSPDIATRYYSILTCRNIFFSDSCFFSFEKLESLVAIFITSIVNMEDELTTDVMTATVAELTRSDVYMDVMLRKKTILEVLDAMMRLLETYHSVLRIQESCCIAIVSICAHKDIIFDDSRRDRISMTFYYLTQSREPSLLQSILSGILVLADKGVSEILSKDTLARVTEIAQHFSQSDSLTQICCAIFRLYSFLPDFRLDLSSGAVLDFLFKKASCSDLTTRELVSVVLCNLTFYEDACDEVTGRGLIQLLPILSCTDPTIQDIYVRCMCNISSFSQSKALMLKAHIPETILMIALVRSVSHHTKQLCLRVLLNLLDIDSIPYYVSKNIVRAFSGLVSVDDAMVKAQCSKGFLVMTSTKEGRMEIALRTTVLTALFELLLCPDTSTKNMVGVAIYNLLCCDFCWATIANSRAIPLIKVLITAESEILREASARVILSLTARKELHSTLAQEPLVHMMVEILRHPQIIAFETAINALAYLSHFTVFRPLLLEKECPTILLAALLSGQVNTISMAEEVVRCLYFLSFEKDHALNIIDKGHVMLSMHLIQKQKLCSATIARMMTLILRNLSYNVEARETLVQEDALALLLNLMQQHPESKAVIFSALSFFLFNLSKEGGLHERLMDSRLMDVVSMVAEVGEVSQEDEGGLHFIPDDVLRLCATANLLSVTTVCHQRILDGGVVGTFTHLLTSLASTDLSAAIENEIANCIYNITKTPQCRELLNKHGATKLLLQLSSRSVIPETQKYCSLALSRLSETNQVDEGVVASLLLLSLKMDERDTQIDESLISSTSEYSTGSRRRGSMVTQVEEKRDTFHHSIRAGLATTTEVRGILNSPNKAAILKQTEKVASEEGSESDEDAEKRKYLGQYEHFFYSIVGNNSWIVSGGQCKTSRFELKDSMFSSTLNIDNEDRKYLLDAIPLSPKPLPKDSKTAELADVITYDDTCSLQDSSIGDENKADITYDG